MNWIKYVVIGCVAALSIFFLVFIADIVAKKGLGLGEPIVYDAHALWGYSPRANRTYTRFDGDIVTFNNVGTRSIHDWDHKARNLLFLGDSVTYGGSYINDEQTFASLACNSLKGWLCHNAGVNAYGILNMVARSRYDERINSAPIRIFTFISGDFDRGLQKSDTAHFILREPPLIFSGLWEILNFVAASINPKAWFGKRPDNKTDVAASAKAQQLNQKFALDILVTEIERLKRNNQRFLLVHSPGIDELESPNLLRDNQTLSTLRALYPEEFVSLSEALSEPYRSGTDLLFKDSVHYEQQGHRIVANYLAPRLQTLVTVHSPPP